MLLKDVLQAKGGHVVTVSPDTTVRELIAVFAEHNIGAVVVSTDESPVAGIVSERDVVRALRDEAELLRAPVRQIMTAEVHTAKPADSVDDLMKLMTHRRVRHVPVLQDGSLLGIVSIGDVVKSRIGELEFERDQLESYVTGA